MAEQLHIPTGKSRAEGYRVLMPQLAALLQGETDPVANMANCCAALRQAFGFFWVGFYVVKGRGTRDEGQEKRPVSSRAESRDSHTLSSEPFSISDFPFSFHQELVLGPFQGDVACTRIGFGKGVCGAAWERRQTILVPDVDVFPGHIACSSLSRSEIVVPLMKDGKVIGVLDVDSDRLDDFSDEDRIGLESVADLMVSVL